MPPIIESEKCNACGVCADICPTDVYRIPAKKEKPEIRYPEECWHCNACVLDCKQEAIKLRIPLPAMMLHVEAGHNPNVASHTNPSAPDDRRKTQR